MTSDNDSQGIRYVIIDENLGNDGRSDNYSFTVSGGTTTYHENVQSSQQNHHLQQQQQQQMVPFAYDFTVQNG
uniref:Uncharacterized protein n=1 Tax=Setaria digitata TaxID=48799 RepID=A0A915PVT5_9BILA